MRNVDRRKIKTSLGECETLAEYRFWVLREKQTDVANRASVPQASISKLEIGKTVPHTTNWARLAQAYGLSLKEFTRLLSGGIRHGTQREGLRDAETVPGTSTADDAAGSSSSSGLSAGLDQPGGTRASAQDVAPSGTAESVPA